MYFQMFHDLFPELAERETRCIIILRETNLGLPPGQYFFHEMFCNERACDCRKVFFTVISSWRKDVEAVVAWGWETPAFYAKWLHDDDPKMGAGFKGPYLNLSSPQTTLSPAILELTRTVLLRDALFVERVKRHYRLFKEKIHSMKVRKKAGGRAPS